MTTHKYNPGSSIKEGVIVGVERGDPRSTKLPKAGRVDDWIYYIRMPDEFDLRCIPEKELDNERNLEGTRK